MAVPRKRKQERDEAYATTKQKLANSAAQAERGDLVDPDQVLRKIEQLKKKRRSRA